ncbi:MAG: HAD family hydrolase [Candidatus Liptonbacteria bacterium]|nr:HAD family hydrolase [Candidatus Liptonbacteria bacterium]
MAKRRAVFLDRDGVINKEVDHLNKVEDLRLLPGAAKSIAELNRMGLLTVIISNQGAVAKGLLTAEGLEKINAELLRRLARRGARIDGVYLCLHHPEGSVKKYRLKCDCRKPNPGMVFQAAKELKIDLKKSFFVGDTTSDMLTGQRAGVATILVETGYGGRDKKHEVKPDATVKNLLEAVRYIRRVSKS